MADGLRQYLLPSILFLPTLARIGNDHFKCSVRGRLLYLHGYRLSFPTALGDVRARLLLGLGWACVSIVPTRVRVRVRVCVLPGGLEYALHRDDGASRRRSSCSYPAVPYL